jgi:hypothetical protein
MSDFASTGIAARGYISQFSSAPIAVPIPLAGLQTPELVSYTFPVRRGRGVSAE